MSRINHRYQRRDQNEYKFTVHQKVLVKNYDVCSDLTKSDPLSRLKTLLHKLFCKPKDWVTTEDNNNIVYETDCSNWKVVCFGESKRSLK